MNRRQQLMAEIMQSNKNGFPGGCCLTKHLRDRDRITVRERCIDFPGPHLLKSYIGEACPVDSRVIDGYAILSRWKPSKR